MSLSYWSQINSKKVKAKADICIVGGGLSGLSTAYWLNKEDPNLSIAIVEKHQLGSGATGKNAGFVTCGSVEHFNRMVSKYGKNKALEIWRFAETNLQLLQSEIFQISGAPQSFQQRGAFSLASKDSEMEELKQVAKIMTEESIAVEVLDAEGVSQRLGAKSFIGGIKYIQDAEVDPLQLLMTLKKNIKANFYENCEVSQVHDTGSGTRQVIASGLELECQIVIYCLNGYAAAMDSYFEDKIYPTRGQIMVLEPVAPFMEGPCYANFYLDYFRQLQDGSLLIGGFRQLESDTEKGYSDHTTEKIQKALHDFVLNHLPQYREAKVSHRWAGVMGFSVDGEPMIGSLPSDNQVFFCGGFTGHGVGLSFHTAKCLVDMIFDRDVPGWLSARRF